MELIKLHKICNEALQHFGLGMMFCYLNMFFWLKVYKHNQKSCLQLAIVFPKKNQYFFVEYNMLCFA